MLAKILLFCVLLALTRECYASVSTSGPSNSTSTTKFTSTSSSTTRSSTSTTRSTSTSTTGSTSSTTNSDRTSTTATSSTTESSGMDGTGFETTANTETIYDYDPNCEKASEPQNTCSLLLEVDIKTQDLIILRETLYTIFKDAWSIIADASQYSTISIEFFVESLSYSKLSSSNDRRLLQTISTTEATTIVTDPPQTATTDTTTLETTSSGSSSSSSNATESGLTYNYEITFSVALFDSSCTDVSLWYTFFSSYSDFAGSYLDYLIATAESYSTSGFDNVELVTATLSQRDQTGSTVQQTTYSYSTSDASFKGKFSIFIISFFVALSVFMIL